MINKILILFVFLITITSCTKDNKFTNNNDNILISKIQKNFQTQEYTSCMSLFSSSPNPYIWMAEYHNENTDRIFHVVKDLPKGERSIAFKNELSVIAPNFDQIPFQFTDVFNGSETYNDYVNRQTHFSKKVKFYANEMLDLMSADINVISNLQVLELEIISDASLNTMEREGLLQGLAIAQGSYCYWSTNYAKWYVNNNKAPQWVKNIAMADAAMAISVAVGIGAGWIVPGANVTAAGLTAGMAAGTSIGAGLATAANWLLEEFTSWW